MARQDPNVAVLFVLHDHPSRQAPLEGDSEEPSLESGSHDHSLRPGACYQPKGAIRMEEDLPDKRCSLSYCGKMVTLLGSARLEPETITLGINWPQRLIGSASRYNIWRVSDW